MIKMYKIPLKCRPLYYLKEHLLKINSTETLVLVPTNRNLHYLSSLAKWELDIQTISEFNKRADLFDKILLPGELKSYYLYKTAQKLSNEERALMLRSRESINYLDFLRKSSALLPFYRELAAEKVDLDKLKLESTYQDYEEQVDILIKLWKEYLKTINSLGYTEEWAHYDSINLDDAYVKRYNHYVFVISGYLTKYELSRLKKIGEESTLELFFNYSDELHHQEEVFIKEFDTEMVKKEEDLSKWLAVETSNDLFKCADGNTIAVFYKNAENIYKSLFGLAPEVKKNLSFVEVLPCASSMAQYDLITRRICEEHFMNGVPFNKMAVILPSSRLVTWFVHSDPYGLYNVSAGNQATLFPFYNRLLNLLDLLTSMEERRVRISSLEIYISDGYFGNNLYQYINNFKAEGALFAGIDDVLKQNTWKAVYKTVEPFLKQSISYVEAIDNLLTLIQDMATEEEREMTELVTAELEKLRILYSKIDEKFTPMELLKTLLSEVSEIIVPVNKGHVTVIGLLESRNLQFDYLFIPDLNSDVFPAVQNKDLYLNSDIRARLGMPTFSDREKLQKSYLYQIIERAKQTVATYTFSEEMQPSSFIDEVLAVSGALVSESGENASVYNAERYFIIPSLHKSKPIYDGDIYKSEEVRTFLKSYKYSATSLACYRNCPLQFFYKYIKQIKTDESSVEDADMAVLGSILHKVMEKLFEKKINAEHPQYLKAMEAIFDSLIDKYDYFTRNAVGIFQMKVLKMQFPKIVEQERERLRGGARILGVEEPLSSEISGINVYGKIDRLDMTPLGHSIIDYKYKEVKEPKGEINFETADLQLPIYALLAEKRYGKLPCEILWFDMKSGKGFVNGFPLEQIDSFRLYFKKLTEDILKEGHFESAAKEQTCRYCVYSSFCYRSLL